MDTTAIIIFLLISIVLGILLYKQFNKPKIQAKPTSTTKEEIVLKYENIVIKFMEENKDLDKKELIMKKGKLLKHIGNELNMNLFFDEIEVKEIMKKLVSL